MKESIESILAIDKKTRELNIQTQKSLENLAALYRKNSAGLEFERSQEAKEKALAAYNKTLDSFDREMDGLKEEQSKRLKAMDDAYRRVKEGLISACCQDLTRGSWKDHE